MLLRDPIASNDGSLYARALSSFVVPTSILLCLVACSSTEASTSDDSSSGGNGGGLVSTGSGGSTAGAPASGGSLGSAGATGGSLATGGAPSTGGSAGNGGSSILDAGPFADARASDGDTRPPDAASSDAAITYHTNFDLSEKPISEGGAWHHTDANQSVVATSDGIAYGTQNGSGGYDDSNAFLSGFPPNQRATAVIHKTGNAPGNLEVELLLRWSEGAQRNTNFGPTKSSGYEINIQGNGGYVQIGRFKGLPALFDSLVSGSPLTTMGVHDADVFSAEIVGNKITARLNGTIIATATDSDGAAGGGPPIATGNPGIGFFRHDIGGTIDPKSCSFTSFTAESL
jgi:hypothetical protein